jgi:hypothetical protein
MRLTDYIVTFILNLLSGCIVVALVEVIKWQLRQIQGDYNVRDKVSLWIFIHSKGILLTGVGLTVILLVWVLLRFPTVTPWVVVVIVVAVGLMSIQLGMYIFLKMLGALLNAFLKGLKKLAAEPRIDG